MSFSHMLILLAIALIVIPPDKLPEVARQLARFINDLKRNTSGLWDDLKQEALLRPEDLLRHQQLKSQAPAQTQNAAVKTENSADQKVAEADETKKQ